jgi:hypothetical protein
MKRRDFIKSSARMLAVASMFAGPASYLSVLPAKAAAPRKLYRGTQTGSIQVSEDGGKSWQLHTNLGPDYSILSIFTARDGRLYAHTGFKQMSFHLVLSKNEKSWML